MAWVIFGRSVAEKAAICLERRPQGPFLFDDRLRTTYTLTSLAFIEPALNRCTPSTRLDAVRWGTHKGS